MDAYDLKVARRGVRQHTRDDVSPVEERLRIETLHTRVRPGGLPDERTGRRR